MPFAARFQQGFDKFRHDTLELVREVNHFFRTMSDETLILLLVMFIMGLFYLIVRQPNKVKHSGSMGRQFVTALAVVVIVSVGIGMAIDGSKISQITRV